MFSKILSLVVIGILTSTSSFSQNDEQPKVYTQIKAYTSVVHPLVNFDKDGEHFNFDGSYSVLVPMGINILKTDKIGFSFEIAPTIKVESGKDQMTSLLFHPGVIFRLQKGFAFLTRLAFDTSGRYGFTPVFSKVVIKRPNVNYFIATPLPVRFGNGKPISAGIALQLGVTF